MKQKFSRNSLNNARLENIKSTLNENPDLLRSKEKRFLYETLCNERDKILLTIKKIDNGENITPIPGGLERIRIRIRRDMIESVLLLLEESLEKKMKVDTLVKKLRSALSEVFFRQKNLEAETKTDVTDQ